MGLRAAAAGGCGGGAARSSDSSLELMPNVEAPVSLDGISFRCGPPSPHVGQRLIGIGNRIGERGTGTEKE